MWEHNHHGPPDSLVSPATVHFSARDFIEKNNFVEKNELLFFSTKYFVEKSTQMSRNVFSTKKLYKNMVDFC